MTIPLLRTAPELSWATPGRNRSLLAAFSLGALLPAAAGAGFSAVFWLVNLDTASGGSIGPLHQALHQVLPGTALDLLISLSKDASTVTPLIALMLTLAVARGALRVLFRPETLPRALSSTRGHFPFTPTYQTTWVQLGLIGTLWSFLLIGKELGSGLQDPAKGVLLLVRAFDTALLSTLSGVIGAFILGPLLTRAFKTRLSSAGVRPQSSSSVVEELESGLSELTSRAWETSRSLGAGTPEETHADVSPLTDCAFGVSRALERLEVQLRGLEVGELVGRILDELVDRMTRAHADALARLEATMDQKHAATSETLVRGLAELGQGLEQGQRDLGQGLRDGLAALGGARQREREEDRQFLAGRIDTLDHRLETEARRLGKAIEERPLALLEEAERKGRQAVFEKISEARAALEGRVEELTAAVRSLPNPPASVPGPRWWERLRLPWSR